MNQVVSKKSLIVTIIIALISVLICSLVAFYVGSSSGRGELVKQYQLTENVGVGKPLKGKYTECYVEKEKSVDQTFLITDEAILDTYVASVDLYKGSDITVSDVVKKEYLDRTFEVAIPITVEGSVANSITPGDMVAIKLTYEDDKKEDATVVSQISVKDVRTSNGASVVDDSSVAAFVIFNVTDEEQSDIKNALKEGSLYCSKYTNLSQEPLKKTYFVSEGADSSTEGENAESANVPTDVPTNVPTNVPTESSN